MKKKVLAALALGAAALVLSAIAAGGKQMAPAGFSAVLNAGQEVPHAAHTMSGASGKFTATLNGTSLKWKLTFAHLTGAATAAHIHAGKKGVAGAVLVPLCAPCKSGAAGTATITNAIKKQLEKGTAYVNVHTAKNPNGEIRGQVKSSM